MQVKKISIGSDHGGYELKEAVKEFLTQKGFEVKDCGCYGLDSVDYPVFVKPVADDVVSGAADKGIVICTTGIGASIAANKVKGIRCAVCSDTVSARLTRLHNDANVLSMGAGIIGENLAVSIVDTFLDTEFSGEERHKRRIDQIEPEVY